MTYRGIVKSGTVVLDPDVELPEGQIVSVTVEMCMLPPKSGPEDELSSLADLAVETGVDDLATNLDHYLYGHPKADRAN